MPARMMKEFIYDNRVYYNPIEFVMAYIGGTWKMPIIISLRNGAPRYADLKNSVAHISDKMLYTQLRELEEKKMITRKSYLEKPPRVEYALTEKAKRVLPLIDQLTEYGIFLMKEAGIDAESDAG